MRNWEELPANAQTIATIESCIDCLKKRHPYPPNMIPDRINFAVARLGYSSAIFILETFMCELTEELEEMEAKKMTEEQEKYVTSPQCFGQFEHDHIICRACRIAVECYERNNPRVKS